ncbi:MAG: hypothetical protein SFV17_11485 [Candidatus Obscuribacter sp.]|nr:hypothetical protein [Candidatus Obscuribacter sp.]
MTESNQETVLSLRVRAASHEDLTAIQSFIGSRGLSLESSFFEEHQEQAASCLLAAAPVPQLAFERKWYRQESGKQSQVFRSDKGDELVLTAFQAPRINGHELSCSPSPSSDFKAFLESLRTNCSCEFAQLKQHLLPQQES